MKNVENINIDQKNNKKMKQIQQNNDNEGDSLNELNYHKLQIENAKKDNEIIKLREEIQQFKKCGFDTSSSFPWPTEFKNRWDTLVHTMIMDNFDTINTNYILLMRTLNIIVKSIYDISKNEIRQKAIDILKCLGLQNISDINISNFYNKFQRLLFQDFFKTLFIVSNELYNSIISKIKSEILKNKKIFTQKDIENILKDINNENITNFIREIYFLCLYMNINEPKLVIKTSIEINYRYYNKNEYDIIEGFAKNKDICIIILNPPMLGHNKPFKGIKPAVFIIENPTKEIIDICEKQKNNNLLYNNIIQISTEESKKILKNNKGDNFKNRYNLINNIKNKNDDENDILNINTNINNTSTEMKGNFLNPFMTINYKTNNDIDYKEKEDLMQQKNFSKTIKKEDIIKMKQSPDYFLKKPMMNPNNLQKYIEKGEENQIHKNLKDKFKNIHFINPQKIANINQPKIQSNIKNKLLNQINLERNDSLENQNKNYTLTEANVNNINMSTPLTYSIIDTTNNMINLVSMKKKLGFLFYSNNKSQSPGIINNKNINNRGKRHIKPRPISNMLNQLTLEKTNNNIKEKNTIFNCGDLNNERINTEIKQNNKYFNNKNKKNLLDSMKNNFKERLSYSKDKKGGNSYNINNIIDSNIIIKTILNNNENELINMQKKKFKQKSNNNLKNINNVFNINNNIKNNNYNNRENNQNLQGKFSLRRKINNSINIARQKDLNKNININSINSTNNNNNININININNNNNNDNNFRSNVILNYDNSSSKITKTEPSVPEKRGEKSFKKINNNKFIVKKNSKKINIKKNSNIHMTINPNTKKLINIKNDNYNIFEASIKNNNTISYKTDINPLKIINNENENYIDPITYNYINNINKNEKNFIKKQQNYIINKNKVRTKNNNVNNINLKNDLFFKNSKYKNLYNQSENNFINKNKKLVKIKDINSNIYKIRENKLKQKSLSLEPLSQISNYSIEKSQGNKIFADYNHIKKNYTKKEIYNEKINKSSNSIKKYKKNNKNSKNKEQNLQNVNIKNYIKNQNKNNFISISQNTKNKKIKSNFNSDNLNINNILIKSSDKKSSKLPRNGHNKISSSDGIKLNFERNKYIIKNKNYYGEQNI